MKKTIKLDQTKMETAQIVLCGDPLELLQSIPRESIDLIITDVPCPEGKDLARFMQQAFAGMHRCLKADTFCVCLYNWMHADEVIKAAKRSGFRVVSHLVWNRSHGTDGEYTQHFHKVGFLFRKGRPPMPINPIRDVIEWNEETSKLRPGGKPVGALTPLVRVFSKPGAVVLDPFVDAGSSLVAAKVCGRRYFGFASDEYRANDARHRLADASSSLRKDARKPLKIGGTKP